MGKQSRKRIPAGRPPAEPARTIKAEPRMVRRDYLVMAVITLIYSVIAFINLGDMSAPQTYYQPNAAGEEFVIEFDGEYPLAAVSYYYGIGNVREEPTVQLEFHRYKEDWGKLNEAEVVLNSVFRWEYLPLSSTKMTDQIRGTVSTAEMNLFEIAFWDEDGNLIPVKSVSGEGNNCEALTDEQNLVPESPSYKNGTYFDEIYHPRTAYEFLHHLPYYETTHPPLGKVIMSWGIALFGMTPFGWRVMGTLFGIAMLPVFYLFLKKILRGTRYAAMGTVLFAFDFMHFSLTRMGTIDSYPVFFILLMYYGMFLFGRRCLYYAQEYGRDFFADKKRRRSVLLPLAVSGIAWGCGAASKWIAVYAAIGLFVLFVAVMVMMYFRLRGKGNRQYKSFAGKIVLWCVGFFVVMPAAIYTASYIPISMTEGYGNVFQEMWKNQFGMFRYHANLEATHAYSSEWWKWPLDYRPLWAYKAPDTAVAEGNIGCISIMGNPILYWVGSIVFLLAIVYAVRKKDKMLGFLIIGLLSQYLPWVLIQRTTFIYHFFASTPFLVMVLVYMMKQAELRFSWMKGVNVGFCVLCVGLFVMFYPVLSGMEVSQAYVDTFLRWMDSWVFYN